MLEKLIKYSPEIFQKGDFSFKLGLPGAIIVLIFAALIAFAVYSYRRPDIDVRAGRRTRQLLIGFRILALLLLAFCLLKPIISVPNLMPQGSYLAVMIDSSKSMQIKDISGKTRFEAAKELLYNPKTDLLAKLESKFKTKLYQFDSEVKSVPNLQQTSPDGESTDIPTSINRLFDELRGVPLSGIILLTDGGDKSGVDMAQVAYKMRQRKIPIHTVAVGSDEPNPDIEIERISAPQVVEEETPVEISVTVKRVGFQPKSVMVNLSSGSRNLKSALADLDKDYPSRSIKFQFVPRGSGLQKYTVSVKPDPQEVVPQNNSKPFFIKVIPNKKVKVLYIAGRPNWEYKFIRRALEEAPNISLVSAVQVNPDLSRAPYRQGVKEATELLSGYPTSKEELFSYDVLIFGNVDPSRFTSAQLQNTLDFVSLRGGGFLLLGDRMTYRSFVNTLIAKALPVVIDSNKENKELMTETEPSNSEFLLKLTSEGKLSPIMKFSDKVNESTEKWANMPTLTGYVPIERAKPGATVLAVHPADKNHHGARILIATEEYGAGRTMFFAPYDSWRWQMLSEASDDSYVKFWQQTIMWLATPQQTYLRLELEKTSFALKEPVRLQAVALDENFQPTNHAQVKTTIEYRKQETGNREKIEKIELDLEQQLGEDGVYKAEFIPTKHGEYKVKLNSTIQGKEIGEANGVFNVEESYLEFVDSQLNQEFLTTVSKLSRGYSYKLDEAQKLPDDIPFVKSGASVIAAHDLWDMPLIFCLILLVLSMEWFLRKRRGLA